MTIDPRRMVTRHAARLGLGALLVVLVLACVWSTVAWGQGLDSVPAGHPVDWASAAMGGGGIGTLGVVVIGLVALAKRLGIGMPRVVIGGDGKGERAGDDEASAAVRPHADGLRAEMLAELAAIRQEAQTDRDAARKERAALSASIADLRTDLYPKHDDPLAVQVRQLAANAQATPAAVQQLTTTLLGRLDRLETDIRGASGGSDAG